MVLKCFFNLDIDQYQNGIIYLTISKLKRMWNNLTYYGSAHSTTEENN